jgi:hypothetical protein
MRGSEDPDPVLRAEDAEDAVALAYSPADPLLACVSVRPGATADTSAAKPAVSAVAPAITQRRVRLTRASAASRTKAARERLAGWLLFPICLSTIGGENQCSVRAE